MSADEIKVSAARTKEPKGIVISAPEEQPFTHISAISAPDSTQGDTALLQSENRSIVSTKPVSRDLNLTVHDVAAFILQRRGEMTAMKLQKLVYYSQAWSLVWDDAPLFEEEIEAWANGPVVRSLYKRHQGSFKVKEWNGDPQKLSDTQRDTIEKVLDFYGGMSSQALSDLSHREEPWLKARTGLGPTDRGSRVISLAAMAEYYSSL